MYACMYLKLFKYIEFYVYIIFVYMYINACIYHMYNYIYIYTDLYVEYVEIIQNNSGSPVLNQE